MHVPTQLHKLSTLLWHLKIEYHAVVDTAVLLQMMYRMKIDSLI